MEKRTDSSKLTCLGIKCADILLSKPFTCWQATWKQHFNDFDPSVKIQIRIHRIANIELAMMNSFMKNLGNLVMNWMMVFGGEN